MPPSIPRIRKALNTLKPPKPPAITAKALTSLLSRIGSASSGTKAILHSRFIRDLQTSRLGNSHAVWNANQTPDRNRKLRIMSIDMGIKNLAFCDAEVSYLGGERKGGNVRKKKDWHATMEVLQWEKIDLVANARDLRHPLSKASGKAKASEKAAATDDEDEEMDPYSLSVLSETAYQLIRRTILTGAPDIILIEKQRWRSGGGSAVQQWTVRVNTLEGMLWAVLATLKGEKICMSDADKKASPHTMKPYDVFAVDPKRVGQYWLQQDTPEEAEEETKKVPRSKAEKKAKINILRSWLSANPISTAPTTGATTPTITFKLGTSAERIRKALCSPTKTLRRSKKTKVDKESGEEVDTGVKVDTELRKLDDVTDCFLQAAAWVSWELNRLQLLDVQERLSEGNEAVNEVDNTVLLEMVKEVGEG
ncbi:hypothetical protein NX059_008768 [Plenodomus lindquistii]|nr:hypothetical protein NX059_008768 [Plenodomus lindquistii]